LIIAAENGRPAEPLKFRAPLSRSHVRLVRLTSADTESLQQYAADPVLSLSMSMPRPFPADGAINFIRAARTAWRARRWLAFSIKHRNEFVGLLTIGCPDPDVAISYWVARPFWNRGYATAAVQQSLGRTTRFFGPVRVLAVCLENNLASQRVLEKNEFKLLDRITISNDRYRAEPVIVYVFEPPAVSGS
jgi:[ribosomal protein S5]-alanine N-acetyltransferase